MSDHINSVLEQLLPLVCKDLKRIQCVAKWFPENQLQRFSQAVEEAFANQHEYSRELFDCRDQVKSLKTAVIKKHGEAVTTAVQLIIILQHLGLSIQKVSDDPTPENVQYMLQKFDEAIHKISSTCDDYIQTFAECDNNANKEMGTLREILENSTSVHQDFLTTVGKLCGTATGVAGLNALTGLSLVTPLSGVVVCGAICCGLFSLFQQSHLKKNVHLMCLAVHQLKSIIQEVSIPWVNLKKMCQKPLADEYHNVYQQLTTDPDLVGCLETTQFALEQTKEALKAVMSTKIAEDTDEELNRLLESVQHAPLVALLRQFSVKPTKRFLKSLGCKENILLPSEYHVLRDFIPFSVCCSTVYLRKTEAQKFIRGDLLHYRERTTPQEAAQQWFACWDRLYDTEETGIVISIEGTWELHSIIRNMVVFPKGFPFRDQMLQVHNGHFIIAEQLYKEIRKWLLQFKPIQTKNSKTGVVLTGHSLGGSLATILFLLFLQDNELQMFEFRNVITFGAPAVLKYEAIDESVSQSIWNIVISKDPVPRVLAQKSEVVENIGQYLPFWRQYEHYKPLGIMTYLDANSHCGAAISDMGTQLELLQGMLPADFLVQETLKSHGCENYTKLLQAMCDHAVMSS